MSDGSENVTVQRLEDQISWYDRNSKRCQRFFKGLKGVVIIVAALIPLAAGLHAYPALTGGLGALIVVLEGVQQMNQYQQNWILYRSTAESLKHEKFLFEATAGPYA